MIFFNIINKLKKHSYIFINRLIQHIHNYFFKIKYLKIVRNYSKINYFFNINQRPQLKKETYNYNLDLDKNYFFTLGSGFGNILEAISGIYIFKKESNINIKVNFIIEEKFYKIKNLIKFIYDDFNGVKFLHQNDINKILKEKDSIIIKLPYTYFKTPKNKKIFDLSYLEFHYDSLFYKEYFSHFILLRSFFGIKGKVSEKNIKNIILSSFSKINFNKKKSSKKIIGICTSQKSGTSMLRSYRHFNEFISIVKEDFEIRSFGSKDEYLDNTLDYTNNNYDFVSIFRGMQECDVIIGTDCGMMHIAERACAKTLWIFGPTVSNKVGPIHGEIIRKYYSCGPCTHTANNYLCKDNICIDDITPSEIKDNLIKLYEKKSTFELNNFNFAEFKNHFLLTESKEVNWYANFLTKFGYLKKKNFLNFDYSIQNNSKKIEELNYENEPDYNIIPIIIFNKNDIDLINFKIINKLKLIGFEICIMTFIKLDADVINKIAYNLNFLYEINTKYIDKNKKSSLNQLNINLKLAYKSLGLDFDYLFFSKSKNHIQIFFKNINFLQDDSLGDNYIFHLENDIDLINFEIYCQKYFYRKVRCFFYTNYSPRSRNIKYCYDINKENLIKPPRYDQKFN